MSDVVKVSALGNRQNMTLGYWSAKWLVSVEEHGYYDRETKPQERWIPFVGIIRNSDTRSSRATVIIPRHFQIMLSLIPHYLSVLGATLVLPRAIGMCSKPSIVTHCQTLNIRQSHLVELLYGNRSKYIYKWGKSHHSKADLKFGCHNREWAYGLLYLVWIP